MERKREKIKRSGSNFNFLFLRICPLFVSVFVLTVLIRPALSEFYASSFFLSCSRHALATASSITPEDARYDSALGCLYLNSGISDLAKASECYRESLSKNPLDAQTWLSLARVYREAGEKKLTEFAIGKARDRSGADQQAIWDTGLLFLQMGNVPGAMEQFKKYTEIRPDQQYKVYELCISLGLDPGYMQENLVPPERAFLSQWLNFLINSGLTDATGPAWEKLLHCGPAYGDYIGYCDFLIEKGSFEKALAVWNNFLFTFGPSKTKMKTKKIHKTGEIWNGAFDLPVIKDGFDWKIGKAEGVRIFLDGDMKRSGRYSLHASFDGTSNPDIYLAQQVVPVEKGHRYTVSGYIKTSGITTSNGIFFEVLGYKCSGLEVSSKPVTGTVSWEKEAVEFRVPPQCDAVTVCVKRSLSTKFDNKISGDVWIDSIQMADLDPIQVADGDSK